VVLGNRATLSSDATWRKWFAWVDKHGLSVRPQTLSDGSRAVHPQYPPSSLNFRLYILHPSNRLYTRDSTLRAQPCSTTETSLGARLGLHWRHNATSAGPGRDCEGTTTGGEGRLIR